MKFKIQKLTYLKKKNVKLVKYRSLTEKWVILHPRKKK